MTKAKYEQVDFWKPIPVAAAFKHTIWKKYLSLKEQKTGLIMLGDVKSKFISCFMFTCSEQRVHDGGLFWKFYSSRRIFNDREVDEACESLNLLRPIKRDENRWARWFWLTDSDGVFLPYLLRKISSGAFSVQVATKASWKLESWVAMGSDLENKSSSKGGLFWLGGYNKFSPNVGHFTKEWNFIVTKMLCLWKQGKPLIIFYCIFDSADKFGHYFCMFLWCSTWSQRMSSWQEQSIGNNLKQICWTLMCKVGLHPLNHTMSHCCIFSRFLCCLS